MSEHPRPQASPRPPTNQELDDGRELTPAEGVVSIELLRRKLAELPAPHSRLSTLLTAIGVVLVAVVASIVFVDNRVAAQTDAGVAVIKAENKAMDARVTTLEKRFDRFDQKMDLLLDAQRVPEWKRPPPLDGGVR
jgi:hypothetical protein